MKLRSFRLLLAAVAISAIQFSTFQLSSAADLSVTSTSVASSGLPGCKYVTGNAGATITAGQAVFFDGTSNTYKLANASSSTLYGVAGIALNGAASGQAIKICTADPKLTIGATLVIGDTIWLSGASAGGLTKTAADNVTGDYVSVMGVAVSTTQINFSIVSAGAVKP